MKCKFSHPRHEIEEFRTWKQSAWKRQPPDHYEKRSEERKSKRVRNMEKQDKYEPKSY
jgi:hypothetical protein